MRKFKKALAFALASAMIVSAAPVSAATTNSAKGTKSTIYTYTVDKSKKANANNKRSWIKVTTKKGYTYKLVNKTTSIVSLTKTRVEAKKAGTAKINVNFYKNGKYVETKSVKITVKKAPMIGAVALDKSEITAGETTKVNKPGKGTAYYYSSNKDVATVDKTTGEITAKAAGTTTITAVNSITKARVYMTLTVNAQFGAKQTGAKEITVTGSGFNADTKVEIKRGTATVDFDSKKMTVASDGKSIIIPTNSLISAAEYTVTAGDKTAKFTGEEAKVTTIDIGDVAVADGTLPVVENSTTSAKTATVGYTVKNQFGEDITKTTSLTASSSKTVNSVNNGEIKLNLNTYDKVGDEITVVLVYTQTGLSVTQKAILSNEAVASEVAVKGIYNENKKELTEDTANDGEVFYLLLDVKDQYGKNMAKKGFTVGSDMTYDLIATVAAGTTNIKLDTKNVEIKTVDGTDYLALKIEKADSTENKKILAGTASVLMITKSGKSFNGEIKIAAGTKVDTFTAAPADVVIGGQDNVFTFTATDTYGNDISDKVTKDMFSSNSQNVFGTGDNQFSFEKNAKTGKLELIFHAKSVETDTVYVASFITATYKPVTVQFTVRAKANPVNITGTKDISLGALKVANVTTGSAVSARTLDVKASDIKVENQYGSEYTFNKFNTPDANGYELRITDDTTKGVFTGAVDSNNKEKFTLTVAEKGSEDCTVQLVNAKGDVVSEYTFTVYAKTMDELKNFTVDDMPMIYYKGDRALTVKGVAGDGVKVTLTAGEDYTVLGEIGADKVISAGAISTQFSGTAVKTVDSSYSVVINNEAGTSIDKTVKVSNAKKVATTATVDSTTVSGTTLDREKVLNTLTIKDQYGEKMETADLADARVAFSGYSNGAQVNKNNTADAGVTSLKAGEVVTAKVTFAGGYTFTTNVKMN